MPNKGSDEREIQRKQDAAMLTRASKFVGALLMRNKKWIAYLVGGGIALLILSNLVMKFFGVILTVSVVGGIAYFIVKTVTGDKDIAE